MPIYIVKSVKMAAVRKHWKKFTIGTGVLLFGIHYAIKKHRDKMVIRAVCKDAKTLADQKLPHHADEVKRVYVFLNPDANNRKASKQFKKYVAPILYSSDMDVTVVTSIREGHIRSLMEFIYPKKTDAIIVAGGDGTLFEVVNGIMKHYDVEAMAKIPIGIVPLGAENRFFKKIFPKQYYSRLSQRIGEATRATFNSNSLKSVPIIEVQPQSGDKVYALSGINWGVFKDAEENRNSFKLFGPLRLFVSYLKVSLRKWPENFILHLWAPVISPSTSPSSESRPSAPMMAASKDSPTSKTFIKTADWQLSSENVSIPESLKIGTETWMYMTTGTVALNMREKNGEILTSLWSDKVDNKDFVKQGWKADRDNLISNNLGGEASLSPSLQPQSLRTKECVMDIQTTKDSWFSVDGEGFEVVPMRVKLLPTCLHVMCPRTS